MREARIIEYSFFRSIAIYTIVTLPLIISILFHIFSDNQLIIENGYHESLFELRANLLNQFLTSYKLIIIVLLSFFLTYRWSVIERDGSYGYWLTQGMSRSRYFAMTFVYFSLITFITWLIGIFYFRFLLGIQLLSFELINLIVLLLFNSLFITSFSLFMGELLQNSEIALILTVIFLGGIVFLAELLPMVLLYLVLPETFFRTEISLPVLFNVIGTLGLVAISFGFHKYSDIEL